MGFFDGDPFFQSIETVEDDTSSSVIETLYIISSILSIVGSGTIILSYFLVKELRRFPFSLVLFLSICDFCFSLKFLVAAFFLNDGRDVEPTFCMIQAAWTQFWGLGSVSWNGIISFNIIVLLRNPFMNPKSYVAIYHAYVWTISIVTTILLLSSGLINPDRPAYGVSGDGTCWIASTASPWWQLIFLLPLALYFFISISCLLVAGTRSRLISSYNSKTRRSVARMLLFSVVFICIWTEPAVHRIIMAFGYDNSLLEYLDCICVSIQGFLNAVVWLSDPYFRSRIKQAPLCLRLMYCSLRRKNNKVPDVEKALLKDGHFGLNSIRKAVISRIMVGLNISVKKSDKQYSPYKEFATEDYDDALEITNFNQFQSVSSLAEESELVAASDNQCRFVSYAPHVFKRIRENNGITSDEFLASFDEEIIMANFHHQKFTEGRSGSFFIFTPDKRFILKTVPVAEATLIIHILRSYYSHLCSTPKSMLCKFYGVYALHSGYSPVVYVLIMNNLFYSPRRIHRRYDLKGSWVRREVGERHIQDPSGVLGMDQDFIHMYEKIFIGPKAKLEALVILRKDALFLKNHGIIDYSLLLGIHYREGSPEEIGDIRNADLDEEQSFESETESGDFLINFNDDDVMAEDGGVDSENGKLIYYFGIIDMLQLYDCSKQSERCAKIFLKCKDPKGLSVQEPKEYYTRFVTAIGSLTA